MSLHIPKNVLEAALGNGQVKRYRDFSIVVFDGEGAIALPNEVWLPAAAWARSKAPSGNRLRDRFLLLQRLDTLVTRRGTAMISGGGAHLRIARLRDAMKQEAIDLKEWNFPPQEILDQAVDASRLTATHDRSQLDAGPASPLTDEADPGVPKDP